MSKRKRRRKRKTNLVSNELLREAYLASGLSGTEVAKRCQFHLKRRPPRSGGRWDGSRVRRMLGVIPSRKQYRGKPYTYFQKRISYKSALVIARALDLDPWEVGL